VIFLQLWRQTLPLILFVFGIGNAFAADKVVVVPLGGEDFDIQGENCPPATGNNIIGGPVALHNFGWYLSASAQTCDTACGDVGGTNLAYQAENECSDTGCGGTVPSEADVVTWFFNLGNPAGWTDAPPVLFIVPPHSLRFGSAGGTYFGKCAQGTFPVS